MEKCNNSSQIILSFLNDSIPYSDTLAHHFWYSRWPHTLLFNGLIYTGYEGLKNTGSEIVKNIQLRQEIIRLFEKTIPHLNKFAKSLIQGESVKDYMRRNFRWGQSNGYYPLDQNKIKNDNYFHSIVHSRYDGRKELIRSTNMRAQEISRIIQLIKNELGED
jgi:hypothetical protein